MLRVRPATTYALLNRRAPRMGAGAMFRGFATSLPRLRECLVLAYRCPSEQLTEFRLCYAPSSSDCTLRLWPNIYFAYFAAVCQIHVHVHLAFIPPHRSESKSHRWL